MYNIKSSSPADSVNTFSDGILDVLSSSWNSFVNFFAEFGTTWGESIVYYGKVLAILVVAGLVLWAIFYSFFGSG